MTKDMERLIALDETYNYTASLLHDDDARLTHTEKTALSYYLDFLKSDCDAAPCPDETIIESLRQLGTRTFSRRFGDMIIEHRIFEGRFVTAKTRGECRYFLVKPECELEDVFPFLFLDTRHTEERDAI